MSRTMKVSKEFVLDELYNQPSWRPQYEEMRKRLPAEVELSKEFVQAHAYDCYWPTAIKLLLEGEHQRRAFEREDDAASLLGDALRAREERWASLDRVSRVKEYEKAGDELYEAYDLAVAMAFAEELRAQGGIEIGRLTP